MSEGQKLLYRTIMRIMLLAVATILWNASVSDVLGLGHVTWIQALAMYGVVQSLLWSISPRPGD